MMHGNTKIKYAQTCNSDNLCYKVTIIYFGLQCTIIRESNLYSVISNQSHLYVAGVVEKGQMVKIYTFLCTAVL